MIGETLLKGRGGGTNVMLDVATRHIHYRRLIDDALRLKNALQRALVLDSAIANFSLCLSLRSFLLFELMMLATLGRQL